MLFNKLEEEEEVDIDKIEDKDDKKEKKEILITLIKSKYKVIAIGLVCVIILIGFLISKPGQTTSISESTLKEMFEISEFSTIEYPYESIISVSDDKGKTMYHVAYKGTVKLGFDFNEIRVEELTEDNKICVYIPEIIINSTNVDESSLDYIFEKEKYDTETTFQEAYRACCTDLQQKVTGNGKLKEMAKENAIDTISALIKPMEKQLPKGYEIEYR